MRARAGPAAVATRDSLAPVRVRADHRAEVQAAAGCLEGRGLDLSGAWREGGGRSGRGRAALRELREPERPELCWAGTRLHWQLCTALD